MLVLRRKRDQELVIIDSISGEDIRIMVVDCEHGGRARLGVSASARYRVVRAELLEQDVSAMTADGA